jgi:polysaccharide export outer membrane protein
MGRKTSLGPTIWLLLTFAALAEPACVQAVRPAPADPAEARASAPSSKDAPAAASPAAPAANIASRPAVPQVVVKSEEDPENAYAIGIGDVVEITVWKNPELSVTVPVRPDGRISVPLLGDIQAAGMTPLALKETLAEGFSEFVTAPGVSVVIKEIKSQRVFVTGEVTAPGVFDLAPRTKLMQILAMAGGLTPYAKGKVIVLRDRGGKDRRYEIDVDSIVSGRKPADNLVLQAGDTIVVP